MYTKQLAEKKTYSKKSSQVHHKFWEISLSGWNQTVKMFIEKSWVRLVTLFMPVFFHTSSILNKKLISAITQLIINFTEKEEKKQLHYNSKRKTHIAAKKLVCTVPAQFHHSNLF